MRCIGTTCARDRRKLARRRCRDEADAAAPSLRSGCSVSREAIAAAQLRTSRTGRVKLRVHFETGGLVGREAVSEAAPTREPGRARAREGRADGRIPSAGGRSGPPPRSPGPGRRRQASRDGRLHRRRHGIRPAVLVGLGSRQAPRPRVGGQPAAVAAGRSLVGGPRSPCEHRAPQSTQPFASPALLSASGGPGERRSVAGCRHAQRARHSTPRPRARSLLVAPRSA